MIASFEGVELSLRSWDDHMARCVECLAEGQHLCYEGTYLTEKVVEARHSMRLNITRRNRLAFPPRLRRPMLPGVPA